MAALTEPAEKFFPNLKAPHTAFACAINFDLASFMSLVSPNGQAQPLPEAERSGRWRQSAAALCSAQLDTLGMASPHLNCQSWNPGKLAEVGGDHGKAVGKTGGRQP
jgi:hypothetical protein